MAARAEVEGAGEAAEGRGGEGGRRREGRRWVDSPQPRSMSRSEAQSPATLERHHTACSRVSTEGEV